MHCVQDMIENTWKWAAANVKIIKRPISGGEFVDIDVEHVARKINEQGTKMMQTAVGHFQESLCC